MIGTVLSNRYKIIGDLGSGGMAWVYLAEDLREDELVAIKVLYPQHSKDVNFLQRFGQEAKLAMSLSQCAPTRQIVCVLDYGSDKDIHYLVMEYVKGQDLGQILAERGPLPWREALAIARQIAMALETADHYEVVHRDIKPGNIMILPDGAVRVLDFGIARAKTSPHLTLDGFVGSPHYAAPEQAMGETVDTRADIYSLGVVIYLMLSGDLPFQGNTPWAVVNQHIASPPAPLEEACPDLPQLIFDLVEKAMAKRPEDRFQTPTEMVQAINDILDGSSPASQEPEAKPADSSSTAEELYHRGQQAMEAEAWNEAIDLFSQVLKLDPAYPGVTKQLAEASRQIRLATQYRSARRALVLGHWGQALQQLDKIADTDHGYKDISKLRVMAENREKLADSEKAPLADYPTQVEAPPPGVEDPQPDSQDAKSDPEQDVAPVPEDAPELPPLVPKQKAEEPPATSTKELERKRFLPWLIILILLVAVPIAGFLVYRAVQPSGVATAPTSTPALSAPTLSPTLTAIQPKATIAPTSEPEPTPAPTAFPAPTLTPVATATQDLDASLTPTSALTITLAPPTPTPVLEGQIAFPRFDPERATYDVHLCHVDGSNCRQVTTAASQPHLLPGGERLVVHTWKADDKGLTLLTVDGERVWKITGQFEAARPSVDFDGQIYAYHSRQEADREPRLYRTFDAETGPIRREANGILGRAPSWTPDGRILYSGCFQDACGILVMQKDGSFPQQVVAGDDETNPEASPDGRRVAFMSRRDGNWEVYVVNMDSTGLQRLTSNPANDGLPIWSPDGRHIAFVSDRAGGWAVWLVSPDGGDPQRLFALGGPLDGKVRDAADHETHGWVEERISWSTLP